MSCVVDPCFARPCRNNGNCSTIDKVNRYCTCDVGFIGVDCQFRKYTSQVHNSDNISHADYFVDKLVNCLLSCKFSIAVGLVTATTTSI